MHEALSKNLFFVKEHVGMFKAANNYDIYDPATKQILFQCREEKLGFFTKLLRFTDYKRMTPFHIQVRDAGGKPVIEVKRGVSIFLSKVDVFDERSQRIGGFKQKLFSIGGAFSVLDQNDRMVCALQGRWTGWDFRFMHDNRELGRVAKKWSGIGKELFTTADNYMLSIAETVSPTDPVRALILASVLCIDMVLKE